MPKGPFGHRRSMGGFLHHEDVLLDLGGEPQEPQDLRDPGPGDAFPAGDLRLGGDLAGVELAAPLDGFAQELGHPGRSGLPGRLGLAPPRRHGGDDPVRRAHGA